MREAKVAHAKAYFLLSFLRAIFNLPTSDIIFHLFLRVFPHHIPVVSSPTPLLNFSLSHLECVCVFRWWFLHVEKHDHFCFLSLNLWCVIWHCMWKKWPLLILLISVFVVTWNCKIPCTSQTPNWRGVSVHRQIVYSQEYLWLNFIMPLLSYF